MKMDKIIQDFRDSLHVPGRLLITDDNKILMTRRANNDQDYEYILDREMLRWSETEEYVIEELKMTISQRIAEIDSMTSKAQRPTLAPIKKDYLEFQNWLVKRSSEPVAVGKFKLKYDTDCLRIIGSSLAQVGYIKATQENLFASLILKPEAKPRIKWTGSNPELLYLMTLIFMDEKKHVAFAKNVFITKKTLDDNQLTKVNEKKGFPKIDAIFETLTR